jgi:hypothetical protein
MSESLTYTPLCIHGIPMTVGCTQCGRWINPSRPPMNIAPDPAPYALAGTVEMLSLAYLDLIADCLMVMAERTAPDGGQRRAQFEQLHVESAPHRGGAQ